MAAETSFMLKVAGCDSPTVTSVRVEQTGDEAEHAAILGLHQNAFNASNRP